MSGDRAAADLVLATSLGEAKGGLAVAAAVGVALSRARPSVLVVELGGPGRRGPTMLAAGAARELEDALRSAPLVRRVHDLHVWTLTSGREAMSAHVVVEAGAPADRILEELHLVLHARFGIDHTTIQIETEPAPLIQITPRAG
jgi:hypothetical protein